MKTLNEIYKELGIAFSFPIKIKDANGKVTYHENSNGEWYRFERDANGNVTYSEDNYGEWFKYERDANNNVTYCENSDAYWQLTAKSVKTCEGKVVEVDGIKYKLTAL